MFERTIHRIIEEGIAALDAAPSLLKRFLGAPGWTDEEVAKVAAFWSSDKGKPSIVHNYARAAASLPCYAIVLAGENENDDYLGQSANATVLDEVGQLKAQIELEIGRRVSIVIHSFQFTYQVFVYTENPDVTLAYYNALRAIMLGAAKNLTLAGFERTTYSGMDLSNMPTYLPENVFARALQVVGYAHLLTASDLDLSPWEREFSRIEGLYVNNAVIGVEARIEPAVAEVE